MENKMFNFRHIEPNTENYKMLLDGRDGCVLYECDSKGLTMMEFDNLMKNLQIKIGGFEIIEIAYGKDTTTFLIVLKPIKPKITDI